MKIAVLGPGRVGRALGTLAAAKGHQVVLGVRDTDSDSTRAALEAIPGSTALAIGDAAAQADLSLLTVPWSAAEATVERLAGDTVVVDCTNPVAAGMRHAVGERSGAEVLAAANSAVDVVKAFNVYGVENLGDPDFGDVPGMLPIAGDDSDAKRRVADLATTMGWAPLDVGPLSLALQLEHMALLWIHMVRVQGRPARFVWTQHTGQGRTG